MNDDTERGGDALDRDLDLALRRRFTPTGVDELVAAVRTRSPATAPPRRHSFVLAAAAALLVLLVLATWATRGGAGRPASRGTELIALWVDAYRDALAHGFRAPSCCAPGADLPEECRTRFASAVAIGQQAGVELCGVYCGGPAGGAVAMLALSAGDPICLFVVPKAGAPEPVASLEGVAIRRRDVGDLSVFEVSRLSQERVLPFLYEP